MPDFNTAVKNFDFCENVIVQSDYEDYINEAANILIALEAFRYEIVRLTHEVEDLEDCISHNDWKIDENDKEIERRSDRVIDYNDEEIKKQQWRVKGLQRECRYNEARL